MAKTVLHDRSENRWTLMERVLTGSLLVAAALLLLLIVIP